MTLVSLCVAIVYRSTLQPLELSRFLRILALALLNRLTIKQLFNFSINTQCLIFTIQSPLLFHRFAFRVDLRPFQFDIREYRRVAGIGVSGRTTLSRSPGPSIPRLGLGFISRNPYSRHNTQHWSFSNSQPDTIYMIGLIADIFMNVI